MICCGLVFGISVVLFGLAPNYLLALLVVVVLGLATNGFMVLTTSRSMAISEPSHHGRVQSLMQLGFAGFGIAAAPLGALAEVVGLRATIVVMGLVTFCVVAIYGVVLSRSVVADSQ